MLIFYGLGNNDVKYFQTKHNVGRILLENLAGSLGIRFEKKDNFYYAKSKIEGDDVYFLYSAGYMNSSGEPLVKLCKYFKLSFNQSTDKLIVLQDDSDQIVGKQKLLPAGGSAGHHGINSIYKHMLGIELSLEKVWRLKIGIRPDGNKLRSETFVLSGMSQFEKERLEKLSQVLKENLNLFTQENLSKAQTIVNSV
jgi:PTH1 family peptidyl-tRNA hydrolase